jgi:hypothetical protein
MTRLTDIPNHQITLYCACGHRGELLSDDLIAAGRFVSLDQVRKASRCSVCGARPTQIRCSWILPGARRDLERAGNKN